MNKFKIKTQKFISFIFIDKKIRLAQLETITDLNQSQAIYSSLSFQFLIMLTAASLISSLGLLSDSGVIIVGAMLIAPLMKPKKDNGIVLKRIWYVYWRQLIKTTILYYS